MIKKPLFFVTVLALIVFLTQISVSSLASTKSNNAYETTVQLPDVSILDSKGDEQRLSALFGNRTVILNFIFTTCNSICPVLGVTMKSIEEQIQDRLGEKVILVSISVDPINDSPERLRVNSEKLGAGPHWHWLTGRLSDINQVLRAFGIPTGGQPEDHPPVVIMGNLQTGKWLRWIGIPSPDILIDAIDVVSPSQTQ